MGQNEYGMQAKMWLSFAFIHRMLVLFLLLLLLLCACASFPFKFFFCLFLACFIQYCIANLVSVLLLQPMLTYISIASFGKLEHTKYSYIIVYGWILCTLEMFLHLRTYSFFPIQLPFPSSRTISLSIFSLSSSFSCSYWNNTIQMQRRKKIVSCEYNFFIIFQYYHTFYGLFKV